MEENNNRTKKALLIVGSLILLLTVISATYAYFSVNVINNFGTSTINATAGPIGTVTLNGEETNLSISLTALDMAQGSSDITYYASSSGATTTPTEVTIGVANVTPNNDLNYYHCTYDLSVTHTGTNDLYTAFTNGANKSTGQIILTINGVDYDFYDGWPTNNVVHSEFYTSAANPAEITAGLRIINDSDINQNYLAGTDIQISISLVNNTLSCTPSELVQYWTYNAQDVASVSSISSNNATKVLNVNDLTGTSVYRKNHFFYNRVILWDVDFPAIGDTCNDIWNDHQTELENLGYTLNDVCNQVEPFEDISYFYVSSYAECMDFSTPWPDNVVGMGCASIENTERVYVKETTANGNASKEVCTDISGTTVCLKAGDLSNADSIRSQLVGLGLNCNNSSSTLSCNNSSVRIYLSTYAEISLRGDDVWGYYSNVGGESSKVDMTKCRVFASGVAQCRRDGRD